MKQKKRFLRIGESKVVYVKRGDNVDRMKQFSVIQTGAFKYGNETATVVSTYDLKGNRTRDNEFFDTRYFQGSLDDFIKFYFDNCMSTECEFLERLPK